MKKTRFTDEQMVTILREADRRPVPKVAKQHGVSAQTIYSWRKHFGRHCQLVEGSALLPREIDAPDRSQQAHVTASHSTNARVRSRRW